MQINVGSVGSNGRPEHAAQVDEGVKSLSALETPQDQRDEEVYALSDDAREVLEKVLQKDLSADA